MQIELFDEFVVLAEELNYHAAAQRLCITQSTLSKHVSLMEREYGVRLFDRDRTGVNLTKQGSLLLESAITIRNEFARSKEIVGRGARGATGVYVTGELDNPASQPLVLELISALASKGDRTRPVILPCESTSLDAQADLLTTGEADVAVFNLDKRALAKRPDAARFGSRVVCEVPLDAIMSPSNPLASRKELALEDLAGRTLVRLIGPRFTPSWKLIERQLRAAGLSFVTEPMAAMSSYDFMTANLGASIVLMPVTATPPGLATSSGLVRVPVREDQLKLDLCALYLEDRRTPEVDALVDALVQIYARHKGDPAPSMR